MRRARQWASVALCSLVAASLCAAGPGPARAAEEVLGWDVSGYVEGGGIYVWGNRDSAKFDQYRDMDSGFLAEILMKAEKKDSPYYFSLYLQNPGREDMLGEGAFGRYGMFKLDMGWDRTPVVFSNSARSIYQRNGDTFNLPPTLWSTIATIEQSVVGAGVNNPNNVNNVANTINGLARPVDLSFNTDVGRVALKYTPTENLRIDLDYINIHRDGYRPMGLVIGGPGGSPNELAVPIGNWISEVRAAAEYATADWGLRFNYVGSFFSNDFTGYSRDNPLTQPPPAGNTATTTAFDRISAEPSNSANTFSLTGTVALPWRTRINGTFSYAMLRQDQDFLLSTQNPVLVQKNTDDAGNRSPDAAVNITQFNLLATSRPIDMLGITARYRYFDYNNKSPDHTFTNSIYPTGTGPAQSGEGTHESYTTQNAGIDFSLRPWSMLMLRAGYEWVHWNRKDYAEQDFTNTTNILKFATDFTPTDWLLARLTYAWATRSLSGFEEPPTTALPNSAIYMWAPVVTNRLDALVQFSFWETVIPSLSAAFSNNNFQDNQFGLLNNNYWSAGFDVSWTPAKTLTTSLDFSYERYNYEMKNRYLVGGTFPGISANDWTSNSRDQYYNLGAQVVWDVIPKTFSLNVGYFGSFGTTTITTANPNFNPAPTTPPGTSNPQATAYHWDQVENNRQTVTLIAKYYLTQKLSLRAGFAYERYNTQDFARDPMAPFMGFYDKVGTNPVSNTVPNTAGVQSVFLGNTFGNYEAYIISAFVRYEF